MNCLAKGSSSAALAAVLLAGLGAAPGAHTRYVYQDTIMTPSGTEQSVTAVVTIEPEAGGAMNVTVTPTGQQPFTVSLSAGGTAPAPQGTPSPQRAQGALILQRIALLAQIKKALPPRGPIAVHIPVLPPGASQVMALPAELQLSGGALNGSASTSTTATIDPQKAKIKGILPARRLAERAKNALTPSHVTLPDDITASVLATLSGGAAKLSGHVTHALSAKGQTTTLDENWSLKPG
jgi:hypothetical protein